jgi:hypothetical protein
MNIMQSSLFIVVLVFFLFAMCRSGLAQESGGSEDTNCAVLLLSKCDSCHYLTRVCYRLGKKSKRGWKSTLKVMIRRGAQLTKKEQKVLLECLSSPDGEAQSTCKEYLGN